MTLALPTVLQDYFAAQNAHDIDRLIACFAPDAKVRDEGEDIRGRPAIRAWKEKVRDKYHMTVEPLSHRHADAFDLVTANVTGTFPGSPIELTYRFGIGTGLIHSLRVL